MSKVTPVDLRYPRTWVIHGIHGNRVCILARRHAGAWQFGFVKEVNGTPDYTRVYLEPGESVSLVYRDYAEIIESGWTTDGRGI